MNESANAVDDNAGAQLFFEGQAAMHPIGSWLVSWAIDEAPDLDFDFVNLPAMPEGSAGDQGSVIGVETGYMVNAHSPNIDLAVEFLALVNSPENVQKFIDRGGDHRRSPSPLSRATWTAVGGSGRAAQQRTGAWCCRRTPGTT